MGERKKKNEAKLSTLSCQGDGVRLDPKADIMQLQNISVQNGYSNPYTQNFSMDFNDDFGGGFNPNGF